MIRNMIEVSTLHSLIDKDLIALRNSAKNRRAALILTTVLMRYNKQPTPAIMKITGICKFTVSKYIKLWNRKGLEALKDHRGGSEGDFTAEMEDDFINTVVNKVPKDFSFVTFSWKCNLLSECIYQNYSIKYSNERIRIILHKNKISYKRPQPKPTKANQG